MSTRLEKKKHMPTILEMIRTNLEAEMNNWQALEDKKHVSTNLEREQTATTTTRDMTMSTLESLKYRDERVYQPGEEETRAH